jgi:hypothetical protein
MGELGKKEIEKKASKNLAVAEVTALCDLLHGCLVERHQTFSTMRLYVRHY